MYFTNRGKYRFVSAAYIFTVARKKLVLLGNIRQIVPYFLTRLSDSAGSGFEGCLPQPCSKAKIMKIN